MMMIPPTNSNSQSNTTAAKRSSSSLTQQPQPQPQPQPQQLKCPRCDSSNTKFCYYNNYSLSQPRHFCKACKRYWTRGGTLRNVPVGGGCRKNKRIKKHQQTLQPSSAAATATVSAATGTVAIPAPRSSSSIANNLATAIDLSSFLYGEVNLGGGYEALGLAGLIPHSDQLSTGFVNNNSSNLQSCFLNNEYPASFGSQAASLLVSSMKQPRKVEDQYAQPSLAYEGLQQGYESLNLGFVKDVKIEDSNNLNNIGNNSASDQWQANYPFEALNGASDSSYMYWNSAMGGSVWPDPSSSSVAPLI